MNTHARTVVRPQPNSMAHVVAIDGGALTGKTTVARLVAKALGFHVLNSGAIYRAVTFLWLQSGTALEEDAVCEIAEHMTIFFVSETGRSIINSIDRTDELNTPEVDAHVSVIAAMPRLRQTVIPIQLAFRQLPGLVADGRDMRLIFNEPVAGFYLSASSKAKAQRMVTRSAGTKSAVSFDEAFARIEKRDHADQNRTTAPLQKHARAVEIDTGLVMADEVANIILTHCNRLGIVPAQTATAKVASDD